MTEEGASFPRKRESMSSQDIGVYPRVPPVPVQMLALPVRLVQNRTIVRFIAFHDGIHFFPQDRSCAAP